MLRKAYWQGFSLRMPDVDAWLDEVALGVSEYKAALIREYERLGRDEAWEYSFVTLHNRPLVAIGDDLYCLSLRLLINRFADGAYYAMLDGCAGDETRIKALGGLFGDIVHEYTYRLWEKVVGADRVQYMRYGKPEKEAGDGLIDDTPNLLIYDAKSSRFKLETARTGKLSLIRRDLEQGVIRAARQLDAVIRDIKAGQVHPLLAGYARIYPIVLTATDFPGVPGVDRVIRQVLTQQHLLEMTGTADLQVVDLEGLELLESVDSVGLDPLAVLLERGEQEKSRIPSVKDLIYEKAQKIPENPRMKNVLIIIMEEVEEWLRTGTFDETKIDSAFSFTPAKR
jgi:hypothetical protein